MHIRSDLGKVLQELRDIAMSEAIKGKHFFLETDMKGPSLKFDTTGKGILTVSIIFYSSITNYLVELGDVY